MFKVGDHVIWLQDGDIGIVTDICLERDEADEAYGTEYFIERLLTPEDTGWHRIEPGALELLGGEP